MLGDLSGVFGFIWFFTITHSDLNLFMGGKLVSVCCIIEKGNTASIDGGPLCKENLP